MDDGPSIEMPRYKSHKTVHALKIKGVNAIDDGSIVLTFEEQNYAGLKRDNEWAVKHKPEVGGYYVVYADGYTSYSPAKAFEEGYTRI